MIIFDLSDLDRCLKGATICHIILLNGNRKLYVTSVVGLHFTLTTLKGQFQGHSDF